MARKWEPMTDEEFERQFVAATEAARVADETEPRVAAARYLPETGEVRLQLKTGAVVTFPASLSPDLAKGTASDLAKLEPSPSGDALWCLPLDVHIALSGLLMRVLGSESWYKQLRSMFAREAGRVRSEAKARASRENGKKGGRPRKPKPPKAASA